MEGNLRLCPLLKTRLVSNHTLVPRSFQFPEQKGRNQDRSRSYSCPRPPSHACRTSLLRPQMSEDALLQPCPRLNGRVLRQCSVDLILQGLALGQVEFIRVVGHRFFSKAASLSLRTCRARKMRDRTAASLIPNIKAIPRGVISSMVDKISGFRSFSGRASIQRCNRAPTCALCKVWS